MYSINRIINRKARVHKVFDGRCVMAQSELLGFIRFVFWAVVVMLVALQVEEYQILERTFMGGLRFFSWLRGLIV